MGTIFLPKGALWLTEKRERKRTVHRALCLVQQRLQMLSGRFWWVAATLRPLHTNGRVTSSTPASLWLIHHLLGRC